MATPSDSLKFYEPLAREIHRFYILRKRFDLDVRPNSERNDVRKTITPVYGLGVEPDGIERRRLRIKRTIGSGSKAVIWSVQLWTGERGRSFDTYTVHPRFGVMKGLDGFKATNISTEEAQWLLETLQNATYGGSLPDPFKE